MFKFKVGDTIIVSNTIPGEPLKKYKVLECDKNDPYYGQGYILRSYNGFNIRVLKNLIDSSFILFTEEEDFYV